jgi:hypothetical protein
VIVTQLRENLPVTDVFEVGIICSTHHTSLGNREIRQAELYPLVNPAYQSFVAEISPIEKIKDDKTLPQQTHWGQSTGFLKG